MKEIKFRAWDGDRTYMPSDEDTYIKLVNGEIRSPGIILEQYTGLKDKNEKEIYEGDIVEWHSVTGYEDGNAVVEWIENRCAIYLVNDERNIYDTIWDFDDLLILGNIYENKELL